MHLSPVNLQKQLLIPKEKVNRSLMPLLEKVLSGHTPLMMGYVSLISWMRPDEGPLEGQPVEEGIKL